MMKLVIRTRNGMVMVFDESGEQMPEYQGPYDDVREKVISNAAAGSVFIHWFGFSLQPRNVPVEDW